MLFIIIILFVFADFIFLLALFSGIWFKTSHIGDNRMKTFMKDICHMTGVDLRNRHITNHSGRKTLIQILQKNEKDRADIVKVTRHSSIEGLKPYELPKENAQTALLTELILTLLVFNLLIIYC